MSTKGKKKFFSNGYYSNEDWIKLVTNKDEFDTYQRKFNMAKGSDKCPPVDLTDDGMCYRCVECQNESAKYVKEYKKHYMIKNQKYLKVDLENNQEVDKDE